MRAYAAKRSIIRRCNRWFKPAVGYDSIDCATMQRIDVFCSDNNLFIRLIQIKRWQKRANIKLHGSFIRLIFTAVTKFSLLSSLSTAETIIGKHLFCFET